MAESYPDVPTGVRIDTLFQKKFGSGSKEIQITIVDTETGEERHFVSVKEAKIKFGNIQVALEKGSLYHGRYLVLDKTSLYK